MRCSAEEEEVSKSGRNARIMALAIVGIIMASGLFVLVPSTVKAVATPVVLYPEPTNPNRVADQAWEEGIVMEQSDFNTGSGYISWFRGDQGTDGQTGIGYATSTDGITWTPYADNPILANHWVFPYVVNYNSRYYLFAKNTTDNNLYLFNLTTNHTFPSVMNGGKPVYYHSSNATDWDFQIFNPGIAVANGVWYMLLEGLTATGFQIGYSYSTLADMNWTTHRSSSNVIYSAGYGLQNGNPYLLYIPERNALLTLYGNNSGTWTVRAAYAYLSTDLATSSNWNVVPSSIFNISRPGIDLCDPSILTPFSSAYPLSIAYGWNQSEIGQSYYSGSALQFLDDLAAGTEPAPTSFVTSMPAFTATSSVSIPYIANDSGSGIDFVELYYRAGTNGSFSEYTTAGNPTGHWTASPIAFDSTLTGGDGLYQYYTIATGNYGNVEAAPASPDASTTVDTVAPSTLCSKSGTAGLNGWYISSVSVTLVSGDATSGIASTMYQVDSGGWQAYGSSFVYSTEGSHLLQYYATDRAGNSESVRSTQVKTDTSNPVLNTVVSGDRGTNGWWIGTSVTVNLTATDSVSGVSSISCSIDGGSYQTYVDAFQVSKAGTTTLESYATDIAGNSCSHSLSSFKLDTADPVTQASLFGTLGYNQWYVSSVNLTLNAFDAVSGVNWTRYSVDDGSWQTYVGPLSVTSDGAHTVEFYSQDNSSQTEVIHNTTFKIDTTDPVTQAILTGGYWGQWYNTPNHLVLQALDTISGVNWTQYRLDGGPWQLYTDAFWLTDDGIHTVEYYSQDNSGRTEATRITTYKIDKTPPVTQPNLSGTLGLNEWHVSSVSLTFEAIDNLSGVNGTAYAIDTGPYQAYTGPVDVTADGNHVIYFTSMDIARNFETARTVRFWIDKTAPSLSVDLVNDTKFTSASVTVSWSSADNTSGVNRTEWSLDGGAWQLCTGGSLRLTGLKDGTHELVLRATDNAGNNITRSVVFRVDTNMFSMSGPVGPWLDVGLILVLALLLFVLVRRRKGND
jgi:hypothetical protein